MKLVIAGFGVSSVQLADGFRKLDPQSGIRIFTEEPYPAYTRVWLPELITGAKTLENLLLKKTDWYASKQIRTTLSATVLKIDRSGRSILVRTGQGEETVPYDKLVLALGARPRFTFYNRPGLGGVFALRTVDDVRTIQTFIREKKVSRVAVIGGGLLGLELANSLKSLGLDVCVIEIFDYLLPRNFDKDGSKILQSYLEAKSIRFVLGKKVAGLEGNDRVSGIRFEDGSRLDTDLVLQQTGVIPEIGLAKEAGLAVNRGILVDDRLATNDPDIHAIGDCIEHKGIVYGLIPPCLEQARCLANILAGKNDVYGGTAVKVRLKVTGLDMFSEGSLSPENIPDFSEVHFQKADEFCYRKIFLSGKRLVGAMLLGKFDAAYFSASLGKEVDTEQLNSKVCE